LHARVGTPALQLARQRSVTAMKMDVRSALECGGSTPPWTFSSGLFQSGVEPPHAKVLRTFSCTVASRKLIGICGEIVLRLRLGVSEQGD